MDYAADNKGEESIYQLDIGLLYEMIDKINDTLVSMRFAVNMNVHFEVLIVKLSELIKRNQGVTQSAVQVDTSHLEKRLQQLEKQVASGIQSAPVQASRPKKNKNVQKMHFQCVKLKRCWIMQIDKI